MTIYVLFLHLLSANLYLPVPGPAIYATQADCEAFMESYITARHLTPAALAKARQGYACRPVDAQPDQQHLYLAPLAAPAQPLVTPTAFTAD